LPLGAKTAPLARHFPNYTTPPFLAPTFQNNAFSSIWTTNDPGLEDFFMARLPVFNNLGKELFFLGMGDATWANRTQKLLIYRHIFKSI
jgi:hypothetical protein